MKQPKFRLLAFTIIANFFILASESEAVSTYSIHDGYITDEVNSLDFLRLDTPGITELSWNQLNDNGFNYLGSNWRLASPEQVLGFWNALDPLANYTDLNFNSARDYDSLIQTLNIVGRTNGEAAHGWTSFKVDETRALWAYIWWNGGLGIEYPPYFEPPGDFGLNQVDSVDYSGHSAWLFRETVVSTVPLPFAFTMFIGGLLMLVLTKRLSKNTS